jgi:hypothetical protein
VEVTHLGNLADSHVARVIVLLEEDQHAEALHRARDGDGFLLAALHGALAPSDDVMPLLCFEVLEAGRCV